MGTQDWREAGANRMTEKPPRVFVTGCPRSGTSLMKVLIMSLEGMHGDFEEEGPYHLAEPGHVAKRPFRESNATDVEYALSLGYKVVIMVRDGRDVMVSRHPLKPEEYYVKDLWYWVRAVEYYDQFVSNYYPNVLGVRYESLVTQPYQTMRTVSDFLGIGLENPNIGALVKTPEGTTVNQAMRGQKTITTAHIGQWKDDDGGRLDEMRHNPMLWCAFMEMLTELGYVDG